MILHVFVPEGKCLPSEPAEFIVYTFSNGALPLVMPLVEGDTQPNGLGIQIRCPYCSKLHHHGPAEGSRQAHCHGPEDGRFDRQYYICLRGSVRPLLPWGRFRPIGRRGAP